MSPNPLTPGVSASKNALLSKDPLVFLYEVEVPTTPPTRLRLAVHDAEVTWHGNTYSRAPMTHSSVVEDIEGNLPTVELTVPNISREIVAIMKAHNGLGGQTARITLVSLNDLGTGQPISVIDFTIAEGNITETAATFRLQVFSPHGATLPGGRIARQSCWYKFRGKRCGYALPVSDTGAITCDHSYDGANGCSKRGEEELAVGLVPTHGPLAEKDRFGGFRSIPKQQLGGGI